ncbi:hypothetical protein BHM03_00056457 [Ensete ventricosum]|nr:hypothetical protein BHM03_00056457 [Ensete ventricosum]
MDHAKNGRQILLRHSPFMRKAGDNLSSLSKGAINKPRGSDCSPVVGKIMRRFPLRALRHTVRRGFFPSPEGAVPRDGSVHPGMPPPSYARSPYDGSSTAEIVLGGGLRFLGPSLPDFRQTLVSFLQFFPDSKC